MTLYTSVDQAYSEPVLREFEARTGIRVRPVFDVEAAKTTDTVGRQAPPTMICITCGRPG